MRGGGLIRVAGKANTSKRQTRLTVKITELGETKVSWRYKLRAKSAPRRGGRGSLGDWNCL